MKRLLTTLTVLAFALIFTGQGLANHNDKEDATVYIVHGINGSDLGLDSTLPVDVYAGGDCALSGFMFGEIAGPLSIPSGDLDVVISLANELAPCTEPSVIAATVPLEEGKNYTIIAHLSAEGSPTASLFENNVSELASSQSRVLVQHTAQAGPVDISLQRKFIPDNPAKFENVPNGVGADIDVYSGYYLASILPPGGDVPVLGPAEFELDTNEILSIYAVGSPGNNTFTLITLNLEPGKSNDDGDGGDDGDDDDDDDDDFNWFNWLFWWLT